MAVAPSIQYEVRVRTWHDVQCDYKSVGMQRILHNIKSVRYGWVYVESYKAA